MPPIIERRSFKRMLKQAENAMAQVQVVAETLGDSPDRLLQFSHDFADLVADAQASLATIQAYLRRHHRLEQEEATDLGFPMRLVRRHRLGT